MGLRRLACLVLVFAAAACRGDSTTGAVPQGTTTTTAVTVATTVASPTTVASTVPPAPPSWQTRSPAPTARQEVASTVADGRVWVIGGLTAAGPSAVVEAYDPAADRWVSGPSLPVALHHASAATFRGEVVVLGGFLAAATLYAQPSARVLALRDGAWVDLPPLGRPRGAAAAAVAGDLLVLAGGRNTTSLLGPTEIFDGSSWRDGPAILTRRDHLSAVSDGRSVFTVGGRFLAPGAISAALERFDPGAGTWERLPAMPTARGGQGAALAGNRLIVVGGEDPTGVYSEVEAYDLAEERWSALPPVPTPRHGLAVERVGDRVVALVGGTAFSVAPSTVAESLGPLS